MSHVAIAMRVEVRASHQHESIQHVEDAVHVLLVGQRRHNHRDSSYALDRVEVPGRQESKRGVVFLGGAEFGIQSNQRLGLHLTVPFR
jgi:hypothetical protein